MVERTNSEGNAFRLASAEELAVRPGAMLLIRNLNQGFVFDEKSRIVLREFDDDRALISVGKITELEKDYETQEIAINKQYFDKERGGYIMVCIDRFEKYDRMKFILNYPRNVRIDRDEIYARKFVEENS